MTPPARHPALEDFLAPAPRLALALEPRPARGIGALELDDLEELLVAVGDREDAVGEDARARLARGRRALEHELARLLTR